MKNWMRNYWDKPDVVGNIDVAKNIGNVLRIVKTLADKYPYEVQFAPMYQDGTIDETNWTPHNMGPGSVSSEFKTLKDAKQFIKGVKGWKPKNSRDDGLDHTQKLIKKIRSGK